MRIEQHVESCTQTKSMRMSMYVNVNYLRVKFLRTVANREYHKKSPPPRKYPLYGILFVVGDAILASVLTT